MRVEAIELRDKSHHITSTSPMTQPGANGWVLIEDMSKMGSAHPTAAAYTRSKHTTDWAQTGPTRKTGIWRKGSAAPFGCGLTSHPAAKAGSHPHG
jgi:hypothetical protein